MLPFFSPVLLPLQELEPTSLPVLLSVHSFPLVVQPHHFLMLVHTRSFRPCLPRLEELRGCFAHFSKRGEGVVVLLYCCTVCSMEGLTSLTCLAGAFSRFDALYMLRGDSPSLERCIPATMLSIAQYRCLFVHKVPMMFVVPP